MSDAFAKEHIAVIDIGSNAVRLVIYDRADRAPVRLHNERNICNLGSDLGLTGRLNPAGVKKALDSIARFKGLTTAMGIKKIYAVATAALRDASDGGDFIKKVKKDYGFTIRLIEGEEEARLSALGVMMNGLGDRGIIGDYGGGSLELIVVDKGKILERVSLPIGSHRLRALSDRGARMTTVDAALAQAEFLRKYKGFDFYALGGAWRSIAKAHIQVSKHPLEVLDQYTLDGQVATDYADFLSRQSPAALESTAGFSRKRVQDVILGALTLERVFAILKPKRLIFSGTGLREGMLFDALSGKVQREDGLIAACRKMAMHLGRSNDLKDYHALLNWIMPVFPDLPPALLRMLEASVLLSDISWAEHEDYQARHAFDRLLVAPLYAVDHPGRAFLALSTYTRYAGKPPVGAVTDPSAAVVGLALRAAYLLTGGALRLLKDTSLRVTPKYLTLTLKGKSAALEAETIEEALQDLGDAIGRQAVVKIG